MQQNTNQNVELSLWGYFVRAITKNYANFSGRARRKEYWGFVLFNMLISVIYSLLSFIFQSSELLILILSVITMVVGLALLIPGIAVTVRRLHDTDRSGWWYFLFLLPVLGVLVLLVFFCIEGTKGDNRFGANPKQF